MRESNNQDVSAVSETIGFIIIFGIIMSGIALITLYGYPALLQEQANANIRNMERNMISLQSDINSLTYKNDPYKETSLQVSGGTLSLGPNSLTTPNFAVDAVDETGASYHGVFYPNMINFNSQDGMSTISLENGAVHVRYWNSPNGSAMLAEPRWFYDEPTNTYVLSFINLDTSNYQAETGIGTVRMALTDETTYPPLNTDANSMVQYNADISNNYKVAWDNYFKNPSLGMQNWIESGLSTQGYFKPGAKLIIKTYNIKVISV